MKSNNRFYTELKEKLTFTEIVILPNKVSKNGQVSIIFNRLDLINYVLKRDAGRSVFLY